MKAYYKGIRLTEGGFRLWHLCSFSPSQRTAGMLPCFTIKGCDTKPTSYN